MPILNSKYTTEEKAALKRTFDTGRIYMAVVKDTRSPVRGGEIRCFILSSGINRDKYENDENYWVTASYAPKFYGISGINGNSDDFYGSPTSFGESFPIPLVGNYVFIFSPCMTGENVSWYWFACPMDNRQNYMIPGVPYNFEEGKYLNQGDTKRVPLCEFNRSNLEALSPTKSVVSKEKYQPIYIPLYDSIKKQGLENDKLRGYSSSSYKRSSPSMSYGYLTPLGNQFTIDDGWSLSDNKTNWVDNPNDKKAEKSLSSLGSNDFTKNNWKSDLSDVSDKLIRYDGGFRLRTRHGTQVLISDSGNIYMINKDGTAWSEITDDGQIDCYSKNGVNVSSDGVVNLHSAGDLSVEVGGNLKLKVGGSIIVESTSKVDITTPEFNTNTKITSPNIEASSIKTTSLESTSAQIMGAVLQGTLQGTAFYATSSGVVPTPQPEPIAIPPVLPNVSKPQTQNIDGQGDKKQTSINTRVPTAEPYKGHDKNDYIPDLTVGFDKKETTSNSIENSGKTNTI